MAAAAGPAPIDYADEYNDDLEQGRKNEEERYPLYTEQPDTYVDQARMQADVDALMTTHVRGEAEEKAELIEDEKTKRIKLTKWEQKAIHQFEIKYPEEYPDKKKPSQKVTDWIEECRDDSKNTQFDMGSILDTVEDKHLEQVLAAMIATNKSTKYPQGFRLEHRKLMGEDFDLFLNFVKKCPHLGTVKFDLTDGLCAPKRALKMLQAVGGNESTQGLTCRSMWTGARRHRKVWQRVAEIIRTHPSLTYISLSTCTSGPLTKVHARPVARKEEHDVNTFILKAIAGNPKIQNIHLRAFGLQENNAAVLKTVLSVEGSHLHTINLSDNALGLPGLKQLAEGVRASTTLKTISVFGNNGTDKGVVVMCAVFAKHPSLTSVDLGMNDAHSAGVRGLVEMVHKNPRITTVEFAYNMVGLNIRPLLEGLRDNRSVTRLDLRFNTATDKCVPALLKLLKDNRTLFDLDFGGNQISQLSGSRIEEALRDNTTLAHFNIGQYNFISKADLVAMEKVLAVNRTRTAAKKRYPGRMGHRLVQKYHLEESSSSKCCLM